MKGKLRSGILAFTALFGFYGLIADAGIVKTVEYVFPDPNTPIGEPDPAVWASSGNLWPFAGANFAIADPGDGGLATLLPRRV